MEWVTGIGGLFFRAADPERLGRWYDEMVAQLRGSGADHPANPDSVENP